MHHPLRRIACAMLTLALALSLATPAAAGTSLGHGDDGETREKSVPIVFDVLVLRPLGLAMTALGAVVYAFPVAPLTLVTRPTDIGKPFRLMVAAPARYTFVDPLGQH
jgi:hypothetical protein